MSGVHGFGAFGRLASGGTAPWCAILDQLTYGLVGIDPRPAKVPAGMAPDLCWSAGERSP
jgi:hypothetical protein